MDFPSIKANFNKAGWDSLVAMVQRNVLQPGKGYGLRSTIGGTALELFPSKGVSETVDGGHPYKGYDFSDGSTPKVAVQYGSHNSIVPTIAGVPLSADLSLNLVTLTTSAKIVYAELSLNGGGSITSASIQSSNSTSPPTSTNTTAYQTLFGVLVTVTSGVASVAVSDNVLGSQAYQRCGGSHLFGLV